MNAYGDLTERWQTISNRKEKYQAYLCSREWGVLRRAVHERSGGICERCGINPGDAVHHLTYKRIYREHLEDLMHICEECHDFTHGLSDVDPKIENEEETKNIRVLMMGETFRSPEVTMSTAEVIMRSGLVTSEKQQVLKLLIDPWRSEIFRCGTSLEIFENQRRLTRRIGDDGGEYYEDPCFEYAGPFIDFRSGQICVYPEFDKVFIWVNSFAVYSELRLRVLRDEVGEENIFFGFSSEEYKFWVFEEEKRKISEDNMVVTSSALEAWRYHFEMEFEEGEVD